MIKMAIIAYIGVSLMLLPEAVLAYGMEDSLGSTRPSTTLHCDTTALGNGVRQDLIYEDPGKTKPLFVQITFWDGSFAIQRLSEEGEILATELYDQLGRRLSK